MRKALTRLIILGLVSALMVGCSTNSKNGVEANGNKSANTQIEEKKDLNSKFNELIKKDDALEVKKYIEKNISDADQISADMMIQEYDILLKKHYERLFNKYLEEEYFSAINQAMNEEYILDIDKIEKKEIREEIGKSIDSGYTFKMLEGALYLDIDYRYIYEEFGKYLSKDIKPYYELRKKELDNPTFTEEYLSIDFKELETRIVTLETILKGDSKIKEDKDVELLMNRYIFALTKVDMFNGTIDSESGKVIDDVKAVYAELSKSDLPVSKYMGQAMDKLYLEYEYITDSKNQNQQNEIYSKKLEVINKAREIMQKEYYSDRMLSEKDRDINLEKAIKDAIGGYDKETDGRLSYYYNKVDLNEDNNPEIIVYLSGAYVSGTGGSTALVFQAGEKDYELISKITLARNPIIISEKKTNGWKDIIMNVSGGGITPFYAQLKFDGKSYPMNPSVEPEASEEEINNGIRIISDDITYMGGIELK